MTSHTSKIMPHILTHFFSIYFTDFRRIFGSKNTIMFNPFISLHFMRKLFRQFILNNRARYTPTYCGDRVVADPTGPFRDSAISRLATMPIISDLDADTYAWTTTLNLADRFQLTPYDAAYLERAQRRKRPLATLDRALRTAARAVGVEATGID
ncbi:MAG TPA: type II toxin-antitoxin system VapC family toxin [Rhodopila sp.]|nr:type II toxin-antitoxin system VapC family toxin [Rhodopila sp.]